MTEGKHLHNTKIDYRSIELTDPSLLVDLLHSAREAVWSIEFTEPVDIDAPEYEVVRQIFTNERRWAFCNQAMARLYDVPDDIDLVAQPVATYFHRTRENEAFIRQVVASGFTVDNALSIDLRHDGAPMFVENSVRAHIVDHKLMRLWGTVRDITRWRRATDLLDKELADLKEVLDALPFALAVINPRRELIGLNAGFEHMFGVAANSALQRPVQQFLALDELGLGSYPWPSTEEQLTCRDIKLQDGRRVEVLSKPIPVNDEAPERILLVIKEMCRYPNFD